MLETAPVSAFDGVFVSGSKGDDKITIGSASAGLDDIATIVIIDGGDGDNSLIVDDAKGRSGKGAFKISKLPGPWEPPAPGNVRKVVDPNTPFIEFKHIQTPPGANGKSLTFKGREEGSEIQLAGLAEETSFEYVGNLGTDRLVLASDSKNLDDVASAISFNASDAADELVIYDSSYYAGERYSLTEDSFEIDRNPALILDWADIEKLALFTGTGEDQIDIDGFLDRVELTADSSDSEDRLRIHSGDIYAPILKNLEHVELLDGNLTLRDAPSPSYFLSYFQNGGVLDGEAAVIAKNSLTWQGGVMRGEGVTIGQGVNRIDEEDVELFERQLVFEGDSTTYWDNKIKGKTGTLTNQGTLFGGSYFEGTFANSGQLYPGDRDGQQSIGSITVSGTFEHSAGAIHYDLGLDENDTIIVRSQTPILPEDPLPYLVTLGGEALFTVVDDHLAHRDYKLIDNEGDHASSILEGYPEKTPVMLDDKQFVMTYLGDNGKGYNVVLDPSPIGQDDSGYVTPKSKALILNDPPILSNDHDDDFMGTFIETPPAHGSMSVDAITGWVTYTLDGKFVGVDTFTYRPTDWLSKALSLVTVSITIIDRAPDANDDSYSTAEDTPVTGYVLDNDTDPDGDALTAVATSSPSHGTLTSFLPSGKFVYTPYPDWYGVDTFTYQADDGFGGYDSATVTIMVAPVNDPPILPQFNFSTPINTPFQVNVLAGASDPDGDPLTAVVISPPAEGDLTLAPDGSLTYTPPSNWMGVPSFILEVHDNHGGSVTVPIGIWVFNRNPIVGDTVKWLWEDGQVLFDPLAEAHDPDGDQLSYVITEQPEHGSFIKREDGRIEYHPQPDYFGEDFIAYTITDGRGGSTFAAAYLDVRGVQDAPVAANDSFTMDEDGSVEGNLLENDSDADFDDLTASVLAGPSFGWMGLSGDGAFYYIPLPDWSGVDSFTYRISDGFGGFSTATAHFAVAAVADPPRLNVPTLLVQAGTPLSGTLADYILDPDGDPIAYTLVSGPAAGTFDLLPDGSFVFAQAGGATAAQTIVVSAASAGFDPVNFTLEIQFNAAPLAVDDSSAIFKDRFAIGSLLQNDSDPDGDPLTLTVVAEPAHGTLAMFGMGGFIYDPEEGWTGTDSFQYRIEDGRGGSSLATATIVVNDATAPLPVYGYQGNAGTVQRSRLTSVTVDLGQSVNAAALSVVGAIVLTRTAGLSGAAEGVVVQTGASGPNGRILVSPAIGLTSTIILTFDNADGTPSSDGVEYNSLSDGYWLLAIPSLGYHSELGDVSLRRLFGDFDNSGSIDPSDVIPFGDAFGASYDPSNMQPGDEYYAAFDFDNSGSIDPSDVIAFGGHFGISL